MRPLSHVVNDSLDRLEAYRRAEITAEDVLDVMGDTFVRLWHVVSFMGELVSMSPIEDEYLL